GATRLSLCRRPDDRPCPCNTTHRADDRSQTSGHDWLSSSCRCACENAQTMRACVASCFSFGAERPFTASSLSKKPPWLGSIVLSQYGRIFRTSCARDSLACWFRHARLKALPIDRLSAVVSV